MEGARKDGGSIQRRKVQPPNCTSFKGQGPRLVTEDSQVFAPASIYGGIWTQDAIR